jgi:hypothetical protein
MIGSKAYIRVQIDLQGGKYSMMIGCLTIHGQAGDRLAIGPIL